MSGSSSGRVRFAIGVPTAKSVCPEWRSRSACQAARTVMKTVAWPRRARRWRAPASSGGRSSPRESPRKLAIGGRGRSVGRVSAGVPASRSFQWASCAASASSGQARCQAAKSAYWRASWASGDGSAASVASGEDAAARAAA